MFTINCVRASSARSLHSSITNNLYYCSFFESSQTRMIWKQHLNRKFPKIKTTFSAYIPKNPHISLVDRAVDTFDSDHSTPTLLRKYKSIDTTIRSA